jgi:undecaprenyl diphosphate synthase
MSTVDEGIQVDTLEGSEMRYETEPGLSVHERTGAGGVPVHLGIIMDGNGRWALKRGMPRIAGHRAGVENLRRVIRGCMESGIRHLSLYAFSTENWDRPVGEVNALLSLIESSIRRELDQLDREGVQLRHMGFLERLSPSTQAQVRRAMLRTRKNQKLILNIGFNYGGRAEILHAIRQIVLDHIPPEAITEDLLERHLFTSGQPDPDMIIRTAGEMRLSNFMLWQSAYTEFFTTEVYWPDFDEIELGKALDAYRKRDRRFGALPGEASKCGCSQRSPTPGIPHQEPGC